MNKYYTDLKNYKEEEIKITFPKIKWWKFKQRLREYIFRKGLEKGIIRFNYIDNTIYDPKLEGNIMKDNNTLQSQLAQLNKKLETIKEDIEHELNGHILLGDEDSWNPEFYTDDKLDYRKLCIYLLSDILKTIEGKGDE